MDVLHTCIWVSDIDETTAYYEDELGLEFSREFEADGVRNYFVRGDSETEIQFKHAEGEEPDEPAGLDHLAVGVDDVDARVDRLVENAGAEVVDGPRDFEDVRIAFVTDPDGYVLELIES